MACVTIISLLSDKILDWSKLEAGTGRKHCGKRRKCWLKVGIVWERVIHTIQNRVSFAKSAYWSIVDNTLNMRQMSTIMNLKYIKDALLTHYQMTNFYTGPN